MDNRVVNALLNKIGEVSRKTNRQGEQIQQLQRRVAEMEVYFRKPGVDDDSK